MHLHKRCSLHSPLLPCAYICFTSSTKNCCWMESDFAHVQNHWGCYSSMWVKSCIHTRIPDYMVVYMQEGAMVKTVEIIQTWSFTWFTNAHGHCLSFVIKLYEDLNFFNFLNIPSPPKRPKLNFMHSSSHNTIFSHLSRTFSIHYKHTKREEDEKNWSVIPNNSNKPTDRLISNGQ